MITVGTTVVSGAPINGGGGGMVDPLTTEGDIIIADAAGAPIRLPVGATGYFLRSAAGRPAWREYSAAGLLSARPAAAAVREGMVYWATDAAAGSEGSQCVHQGGTTYAWVTLPYGTPSDIVQDGLDAIVGAAPAGYTVVSDGAGGTTGREVPTAATLGLGAVIATGADAAAARAAISADTALDQLPVAGALHHWRLGEASSPFADSGSSAVNLAYVAGAREYGRAGVYTKYGATRQRSPTGLPVTDRAEAAISDIASGVDLSIGITVGNDDGSQNTPAGGARIIAAVHNDAVPASVSGILILTTASGAVYVFAAAAGTSADLSSISVDWSRKHRIDVTRVHSTGLVTLYIDGISRATATVSGTMAALTRASLGSISLATSFSTGVSELMMADFTVHTSSLSAATILTRADTCRRLAGG